MESQWKVYSAVKRLLFVYDLVPKDVEEEQRFFSELIKILEAA